MLNLKYLDDYSEIIAETSDIYSTDTTLTVSDLLQSETVLLKIKQLLKQNLPEQEFLNKLRSEFPEYKEINN